MNTATIARALKNAEMTALALTAVTALWNMVKTVIALGILLVPVIAHPPANARLPNPG